MTAHARRAAAVVSTEEGDRIAQMVLDLCREVRARQLGWQRTWSPVVPEPTGIYVDRDVARFVMRRAS